MTYEYIYILLVIILFSLIIIIEKQLEILFVFNNRVKKFKEISEKYSLDFTYSKPKLFFSYGNLNNLVGNINGRKFEIIDEHYKPSSSQMFAMSISVWKEKYAGPGYRTRIIIDGNERGYKYKERFIFFRNPFMSIADILKVIDDTK